MKYKGTSEQLNCILTVMGYLITSIEPLHYFDLSINSSEIGTKFVVIAPGGSKLVVKFYYSEHTLMVQGSDRKAKDEFRRAYVKKVVKLLINAENAGVNNE